MAFPADVAPLIIWQEFDLSSADWPDLIAGTSVVHHYAWSTIPSTANSDPQTDLSTNVQSTLNLLEALRRCHQPPRLVFISSGGTVYGRLKAASAHEDHPRAPITAYGAGKASIELYLGYYREIFGLDCRVARLANPFGAGQNFARGQGAVTTFLERALASRPITIWGDGETIRDYIHVSDAAAGLAALALAPALRDSWIFNIGSGHGISLNGVLEVLEATLCRRLIVHRQPARAFDVPISVLDITRAKEQLHWSPRLSFSDGVVRTLWDLKSNVLEGGVV